MSTTALVGMGVGIFFVQYSLLPFVWPGAYPPDLWLVVTVLVTLFYGGRSGLWLALVAGLAADIAGTNFFGIHLASYLAVVLATSPVEGRLQRRWNISVMWTFLMSLLAGAVTFAVLRFSGADPAWGGYFAAAELPRATINAGTALLLHWWLRPSREKGR